MLADVLADAGTASGDERDRTGSGHVFSGGLIIKP
jgi:hypothetical protein